jgi:ribosomal protein S10
MYKIYLKLRSFDLNFLNQTENYLLFIFSFFNLNQVKHQINSKRCKKITVLRSPHIDKKSREQFQILSHKKTLVFSVSDKNVILFVLEILKNTKFIGAELEFLIEFSTLKKKMKLPN